MGMRVALAGFVSFLCSGLVLQAAEPPRGPARAPARRASKPAVRKPAPAAPALPVFTRDVLPIVQKYCYGCHGPRQQIAGIGFHTFKTEQSAADARGTWEKIATALRTGHMPPRNAPQPSTAQRDLVDRWVREKLLKVDCGLKDPGRVTLRRLNRAEYNNTIRDLLGIDFRPADDFLSDDVGYGFDNIGDVLSLSPLLMEKYLAAAEEIARKAIATPDPIGPVRRIEPRALSSTLGDRPARGERVLASNGELFTEVDFPEEGDYRIRVRAYGQQAGAEPVKIAVRLDGADVARLDVTATASSPKLYEVRTRVAAGKRRVGVAFLNDFYDPAQPDPNRRDRNLAVAYIEVCGPPQPLPAELPESHRRLFSAAPAELPEMDRARRILGAFARRAYRRAVTPVEVERLVRCVALARQQGESFERGIQLGVVAALVSPHFLFHVELDPPGTAARAIRALGPYELASRLSYFLWSSMPDEELFRLAGTGELRKPAVLEAQARRMLRDPRSRALVENFGGQWLTLRTLSTMSPDPGRFPSFNEELRSAMLKETELFFDAVVREDRSVIDFLDGRFTYLNERLAKHYGIPGVTGEEFRRVNLPPGPRAGVLTHASILTLTSNPTRTSPVKRGKWVLEQIFGTPPPPPPPNVPELEVDKGQLTGTLRQQMEQHRKDPGCASCHSRLDPLGFGLENFDAVGAWREKEGDHPIDASGELPGGQKFNGPAELRQILLKQKDQFVSNLSRQMLTYALGRGLESSDQCAVDEVAAAVRKNGYRFSALVAAVVKSEPFRMRRGEGKPE